MISEIVFSNYLLVARIAVDNKLVRTDETVMVDDALDSQTANSRVRFVSLSCTVSPNNLLRLSIDCWHLNIKRIKLKGCIVLGLRLCY